MLIGWLVVNFVVAVVDDDVAFVVVDNNAAVVVVAVVVGGGVPTTVVACWSYDSSNSSNNSNNKNNKSTTTAVNYVQKFLRLCSQPAPAIKTNPVISNQNIVDVVCCICCRQFFLQHSCWQFYPFFLMAGGGYCYWFWQFYPFF